MVSYKDSKNEDSIIRDTFRVLRLLRSHADLGAKHEIVCGRSTV